MTQSEQLFGLIGGIQTLLDNFPMSILDRSYGKTYTSLFAYLVDVLNAVGVPTNKVIDYILSTIFDAEVGLENTIEKNLERAEYITGNINEQSKFIQTLEASLKVIIQGMLTSILTCSAIPVLPNKMFDVDTLHDGNNVYLMNDQLRETIDKRYDSWMFRLPVRAIDPYNMLKLNPCSEYGRLYYAVDGGDRYFKKTNIRKEIEEGGEQKYMKQISLILSYNSSNKSLYLKFKDNEYLDNDFNVTVFYYKNDGKSKKYWKTVIKKNTSISDTGKFINSSAPYNTKIKIAWIKINCGGMGLECGGKQNGNDVWIHVDKDTSEIERLNFLTISDEVRWGYENHKKVNSTTRTTYEVGYQELSADDIKSEKGFKPVRVNYVPSENVSADDPEYLVCYQGSNPNMLYHSYDMNAFIWYVINKGSTANATEYNHMMWDSRWYAKKNGMEDWEETTWNRWYDSKQIEEGYKYPSNEFVPPIGSEDDMHPIIQLEPSTDCNAITIHIPSQRYFLPYKRKKVKAGAPTEGAGYFNASLYTYNWEYLQSIQLLHPKFLITRMLEHLLGFSLSDINFDCSFTTRLIKEKLSKAVTNIIQADDMEVEDCYMTFSNDEINEMLNEMLLEKYTATEYNGQIKTHRADEYVKSINSINASAEQGGASTQIKKLITDVVSFTPSDTEPELRGEFSLSVNGDIFEKLLWSITYPIIESLFTPQLMLLILMNFKMMGLVNTDGVVGADVPKIINIIVSKVLKLAANIVKYIKDMIIELVLVLFFRYVMPLLIRWKIILIMEKLADWLLLLQEALNCLPLYKFQRRKIISAIDNVEYADIYSDDTQTTPETDSNC